MEQHHFGNIQPHHDKPQKKKADPVLNRREFLMYGTIAATLASTGALYKEGIHEKEDRLPKSPQKDYLEDKIAELQESTIQQSIHENDQDIIGKTFRQQIQTQEHITIDKITKKAIYDHWHEKYKPGGENHQDGLIAGLNRMRPWITDIRAIFHKYDIPEECMYVAIAESHFNTDAVSHAHAVGPYQITPSTAKQFDLIVTDAYDERRDPLKSAELCAQHLRYSYEKFNHDWSLALMDYNGGFTKKYLEHIIAEEEMCEPQKQNDHIVQEGENLSSIAQKYNTSITLLANINRRKNNTFDTSRLKKGQEIDIPQERKITINSYNAWLEKHINTIIDNTKDQVVHTVQVGETLETIAKKYHTDEKTVSLANNLSESTIAIDQKITIPFSQEKRVDILLDILSSYQENINYPEKFYAIRDIIKNGNFDHIFSQNTKTYHNEKVPHTSQKTETYTLQKNDTFGKAVRQLYKKFKIKHPTCDVSLSVAERMIVQQNKITKPEKILINSILSFSAPVNSPPSPTALAKNKSLSIDNFYKINPAIRNVSADLPQQATIHIPKK